jgi:hypothetical protein
MICFEVLAKARGRISKRVYVSVSSLLGVTTSSPLLLFPAPSKVSPQQHLKKVSSERSEDIVNRVFLHQKTRTMSSPQRSRLSQPMTFNTQH